MMYDNIYIFLIQERERLRKRDQIKRESYGFRKWKFRKERLGEEKKKRERRQWDKEIRRHRTLKEGLGYMNLPSSNKIKKLQ